MVWTNQLYIDNRLYIGTGEIEDQLKDFEHSRIYQFYGLPIISSSIIILANLISVINSRVTTWCIADAMTRVSSRIVELAVIILFSFCVILLIIKKANVMVLFFTITVIGLQLSLFVFIARANKGELCTYPSKMWAYLGIFITLVGAIINTGCLYFNYVKARPTILKKTIIWHIIGGLVYIVVIFALCYLALHASYGFEFL